MYHYKRRFSHVVALSALAALTACVNSDYDLDKNIDTTMQFGESVSLPIKKMSDIRFCDILKIDENENLDTVASSDAERRKFMETGDLYLHVGSKPGNENTFKTDEFSFNLNNCDPAKSEIVALSALNFELKTVIDTDADDVPYEVRKLEYVVTSDLSYKIELGYENVSSTTSNVKIETLNVVLPEIFVLAEGTGYTKQGNTAVFTNIDIANGHTKSLLLNISQIQVQDGQFTPSQDPDKDGYLKVVDNVTLKGTISKDGISGVAKLKMVGTPTKQTDIKVKRAKGTFRTKKDFQEEKVFEIGDLPDFLSDKKNSIKIACPLIKFGVTNDKDYPIEVFDMKNLDIRAQYEDGTESEKISIKALQTDEKDGVFFTTLFDKEDTAIYVEPIGKSATPVENLGRIICNENGKLAKKFFVTIKETEISGIVQVAHEYKIKYEVTAPLRFKKGTHIEYNDTLKDWNKDLKDTDLKSKESWVLLRADAVSTLPFDFVLNTDDLYFVDTEGKKMDDVDLVVEEGENIKANATTPVIIRATTDNLEELFKTLDGLKLKFNISVNNDTKTLNNSKNTIQFKDMRVNMSGPTVKV